MSTHEPRAPSIPDRPFSTARKKRWWIGVMAMGVVAAGAYVFLTVSLHGQSSAGRQGTNPAARGVPVVAASAKSGDIGVYLSGLGSVIPLNTVTVKSRVDGQLMEVRFKEGQIVKAGDLLALIDPRPFEVQLTQAEGALARDEALLANARLDLKRYSDLFAQDSIAKQQLDTQEALVRQYEGTVKSDQGVIDSTQLNLIYSRITAPVSGRVGLRLVDAGNIVHATDASGLVVITELQPITVVFTIAEDSLPPVLQKIKNGEKLTVEAYDREGRRRLATGELLTVDNQIDSTTGTVRLRALFANKEFELFPNQFVNASLLLEVKYGAILVPVTAIQKGPQGTYVYVVKPDQTVSVRPVGVGATQGDEASVDKGLSAGEVVVTDGAERLREGSKADVQIQGNSPPRKDKA